MAQAISIIASACLALGFFPKEFKSARTVVIRKLGKESYAIPKAWRPIALLPTIGKVIETLIAGRLADAVEAAGLLPKAQMGNRPGRSTETAIDLLVAQIRTTWLSKRHVATLLSMDIAGAFDLVNYIRLLYIL